MEKFPGGTVESVAFIQQDVDDKQEEEARCRGGKEGGEDEDGRVEESTHRSQPRIQTDGTLNENKHNTDAQCVRDKCWNPGKSSYWSP
ncbi:hypothetical protein NDU88_005749 [Pleurodeles waltl]|uniref:Uncharacterized protein n=1 Tax=Pleurodeles waltl TaxID=8319 RepID=A0AAV7WZ68_PLEWA|nr:hypothetical protein NDU88_005749 [Pleurodeles waltl]